jgi:hypothetical protein
MVCFMLWVFCAFWLKLKLFQGFRFHAQRFLVVQALDLSCHGIACETPMYANMHVYMCIDICTHVCICTDQPTGRAHRRASFSPCHASSLRNSTGVFQTSRLAQQQLQDRLYPPPMQHTCTNAKLWSRIRGVIIDCAVPGRTSRRLRDRPPQPSGLPALSECCRTSS